jgi:Mg2+ and Co2+ transporter CorA
MPRPKTAKKKIAKKTMRKTIATSSATAELEAQIISARAKLSKAHTKETFTQGKVVAQLQKKLSSLQAKLKQLRDKKATLTAKIKEKPTASLKNQLTKTNDSLKTANEQGRLLRAELSAAKSALAGVVSAQKKFLAQEKALAKFDRDFAKASAPKKRRVRRTAKPSAQTAAE